MSRKNRYVLECLEIHKEKNRELELEVREWKKKLKKLEDYVRS